MFKRNMIINKITQPGPAGQVLPEPGRVPAGAAAAAVGPDAAAAGGVLARHFGRPNI